MLHQGASALALPIVLVSGATILSNLLVVRQKPNLSVLQPKVKTSTRRTASSGSSPRTG